MKILSARQGRNPIRELSTPATAIVLGIVVFVISLYADYYWMMILRDALVFGIFALSLDYLWGRTGLLSFGHATFFGIGAYAVAILSTNFDIANITLLALLAGILASGLVALLFGYFLLFAGVRGPYFTIMTLALTVIASHIAVAWVDVTGGDSGITGVQPLSLTLGDFEFVIFAPQTGLYVALALLLILLLVIWKVATSRYGRLLKALEVNELRARTLGYNTPLHLVGTFTISAMIAALAGGLYASFAGYVAPDLIGLLLSTKVIVWVAVGGRGTLIGPVLGAVFVMQIERELSSINTSLWPLFIGLFFIAMVFLFPNGLVGLVQDLSGKMSKNQKKGGTESA
ncbi:MAG: branched-chain amino acid ABC transporter permease [Pseudomonadota bacterium]|uniref:branched-chain amino acid ABC transporter permease n=1 Tax=Fodinicurvata fenggangensis TaxID=1121830 RepID=UPI00068F4EB0|nr:branched-chain amino acid ABC transporter permease [Fodinicurvata fenggangensis]